MPTPIETATIAVVQARAGIDNHLPDVITAFERTLSSAFDALLNLTIREQPAITTAMNPADLAVLKVNVTTAMQQARNAIPNKVNKLDVKKIAEATRGHSFQTTNVKPHAILSPLLTPTIELLKKAGYNVSRLREQSHAMSSLQVDLAADTAAAQLDGRIQAYGAALQALEAAEKRTAADAAQTAWDNA